MPNPIEKAWLTSPSRRKAMLQFAGLMAASPLGSALAVPDPKPFSQHHRALSLPEVQTVFDFEPLFYANVPQSIYDYTTHGDGSEFTLRRNRQAYDWVDILASRNAVPASQVDLSTEFLGAKMKYPLIVAPTAAMVPLNPDGEAGMYKAATAAGALMILSINTSMPVDKVAPAAKGQLWGQFYPTESLTASQKVMDAYEAAGVTNIIVTVDQQASNYERTNQDRNLGGRVAAAGRGGARGGAAAAAPTGSALYRVNGGRLWYTWEYIDAMRKMIKGKMILKGILEPEDAELAIAHGADSIIVSNHGGRSMDYGPSTLESLPAIVAAVNGKMPIMFDSGIRRGADIFKALALGANVVMTGRATRWGLAAFGQQGAQRAIEMLQQELVQTAAAAGCAKLSDIDKTRVRSHFV